MSLFSLNKAEKLKSRKAIERLFQKGKSFTNYPFRLVYFLENEKSADSEGLRMAVSIPKRSFAKAVKRNRLKRQVREVYRLNKAPLKELLQKSEMELQIMFLYTSKKEEDYKILEKSMIKSLKNLFVKMEQVLNG